MLEAQILILKDGRKLGYAEYGDPKGKPLFYFHGWPSSRLSGLETDIVAKKLSIRVISIDRPGYGLSDYLNNRTLLDWPSDVLQVADELHLKKFSIVGVSGGGPYSAVCAYKIPERINKAGIVVGLAPTTIKGNLKGMNFLYKICWLCYPKFSLFRNLASFWVNFQNKYLSRLSILSFMSKDDRKLMTKDFKHKSKIKTQEAFKQGIKGASWDLYLYTKDWRFDLSEIKTNVYLWYGESDKNAPLAMGKYYKHQITNSKLTIFKGGHLSRKQHMEEIMKNLI